MATITDAQVRTIWKRIYRLGQGKEEMKENDLPSPAQLKAIIQAVEDSWIANQPAMKAAMDVAASRVLTNAQAKIYGREWLKQKAERGG